MTIRKLDANDLENFRATYAPGKEHLWPLEKVGIVNDLRCLLATYDELTESAAHYERQWAGVKAVLEAGTFESAVEASMRVSAERDNLRSLLKDGFAYVRDANRLMAESGDLDEEDEDGANEWLEKVAAALVEG